MSDSKLEHKVVVSIFGEEYPLTGYSDPDYITRVADYVDSRMKEVAKHTSLHARDRVAILAALSIASELDEYRQQQNNVDSSVDARITEAIQKLDAVLATADQVSG
jgi:cell division protein ZapA (FtsZ GTPase activity inhibitor)